MEEVPALFGREEVTDFTNCVDELIECSGTNTPEVGFQFGESHLDGIQVRAVCGSICIKVREAT